MSKKSENQVVVTRSGYEDMTAELTHLRTVRRQEVARQLEEARAFGDLSENAEYAAAKEEQSKVEGRILELETMLSKAAVVDEEKLDTDRVAIGLTVTLEDLDSPGKTHTYTLVGSEELSSAGGTPSVIQRISQKSPVGQAILGHGVGDEVAVKIPHGMRHLRIAAINRGDNKEKPKPKLPAKNPPKKVPPAKVQPPAKKDQKAPPAKEQTPKKTPPKEPPKTAAASKPKPKASAQKTEPAKQPTPAAQAKEKKPEEKKEPAKKDGGKSSAPKKSNKK